MARRKSIAVKLPNGWRDYTKANPDALTTFVRTTSDNPGVLQLSLTLYEGGDVPNPSLEKLTAMASGLGNELGKLVDTSSGKCALGTYGSAVYESDEAPRSQAWYLSNGRDFVLVTHICSVAPNPTEVEEVQQIVGDLRIREKPWWMFW